MFRLLRCSLMALILTTGCSFSQRSEAEKDFAAYLEILKSLEKSLSEMKDEESAKRLIPDIEALMDSADQLSRKNTPLTRGVAEDLWREHHDYLYDVWTKISQELRHLADEPFGSDISSRVEMWINSSVEGKFP